MHDLHIWTLTSGIDTASGHVVVEDGADPSDVLDRVTGLLATEHGIAHSTIQCEPAGYLDGQSPVCEPVRI